ncbi:MAG: FAD-dependent thymidylate synthase, partial [Staphylococcus lugdunensis]|nr:FAD-dependent thymidylate synthase [Staphylococcus lugdunensis]
MDFLNENGLTWIQKGNATEAEHLVEASGRLCYMSFGEQNQSPRNTNEYIMNLIVQGHESVLEHLNWTFLITGVSRAFTHQLVRHRAGFSYSQLSQQYHDESEAEFVVPIEVRNNP